MRNSSPKAGDVLLRFENVTLRFGTQSAFPRTNWTIRAGEQWAILGPNNSGKSLLAAALAGEVLPARGEVNLTFPGAADAVAHHPVALVSPHTHRAVANAESSFYQSRWHSGLAEGRLKVSQFLSQEHVEDINPFEVDPRRTPRPTYLARRRAGIRLLRLAPLLRRKLICLSNGEMRRTLLARALLLGPRVLVLDEPFAGLDVETRRHLSHVIEELRRARMEIVIATSRPDEVPSSATHLLLVERQRIIARGAKAALWKHPLVKRLQTASETSKLTTSQRQPGKALPVRRTSNVLLVEIKEATIRFGAKKILDRVSWTIRRGEHWALIGPNGSGKTTLLSLIQGDNPQAYAQNIRLFGVAPDSTQTLWQARRRIGWYSPELHLHYPTEWNCLEVVCSGYFDSIGLFEPCTAHQRREAKRLLRLLGFARWAGVPLGELSLSDQRLVLLARSLVKRPWLLVLDEPCQALDRTHRQLILSTVDRMAGTSGFTLVFVTHHKQEIPQSITHLLNLKNGRVTHCGSLPTKR